MSDREGRGLQTEQLRLSPRRRVRAAAAAQRLGRIAAFEVRQKAETSTILDFFIRFLSSRMRFKRNGSYTLNR